MNSEIGEARIKCIYDSIFRPCVCWGLNMGQGRGGPQSATLVPILLQFERTWQVVSGGKKYRQGHNERYPANTVNRSPTTNDDPYSRHKKCLRGCIFTIQNSHTWVTHAWLNPEAMVAWELLYFAVFDTAVNQNPVKLGPGKKEPHPPIKCQPASQPAWV